MSTNRPELRQYDELIQAQTRRFLLEVLKVFLTLGLIVLVGWGLASVKSVDDTFDRYVPGYTIAKQFSPAFWVTREAYYLLKGYNQDLERGAAAIKTVGKIKDWKYVTREYKHNMLVDLCQSGTGWLGPFSGEDKEDAIIKIMDSIRDKAEYDWIIEGLDKRHIDLNEHVDFSQQNKLDGIRAKYR